MALPQVGVEFVATAETEVATKKVIAFTDTIDDIPAKTSSARGAASKLGDAMQRLGRKTGGSVTQIRMLPQQLSQVFQQAAAGTSILNALAIQAFDIGAAFGAVGVAAGIAAGVGIPLLVAAFSDANAETRDYIDVISDAEAALQSYNDAAQLAKITTGELAERFLEVTPGATAFARALSGIAEREALARIQEAVDLVALFGREAGQGADSLRGETAAVAAVFDVNVALAFGRAALEARDRAREMTEAFVRSQIELENAGDDLEAQSQILQRMLRQANELANETGGITAEEDKLLRSIADALALVEGQIDATNRAKAETLDLAARWSDVQVASSNALEVAAMLESPVRRAANAAADFATNLFTAARTQAQIIDTATRRGGGRGGDPRTMGLGATDLPLLRMGGEFIPGADDPRLGGGAGGGGAGDGRLQSLIETLQTEQELAEQFRQEGLELLMSASEAELEALGGINEAKLRLEEEFQERMRAIREKGHETDLSMTLGAGATILGALGQFNDKALKLAKVAGAAQALVSTFQGQAEALKLPFPENLAAAAIVGAKGLGLVAAIKGVSGSGGGGGVGGAAAGAAGAVAATPQPLAINISGAGPDQFFTGSALFDAFVDAARDRGLDVVFST